MNRIVRPLAIATILSAVAGGCAQQHRPLNAEEQAAIAAAGQRAADKLAESSERAATAQAELARIQEARTRPAPRPFDETLAGVPSELRRAVTLEWSGPGVEAARRVATIVGYEFRIVGNPPATPVSVHVSQRESPAAKVLEDIGLQSQPFGQVVVDPNVRRIEYRFLNVAGRPAPRGLSK